MFAIFSTQRGLIFGVVVGLVTIVSARGAMARVWGFNVWGSIVQGTSIRLGGDVSLAMVECYGPWCGYGYRGAYRCTYNGRLFPFNVDVTRFGFFGAGGWGCR